MNNIKSKIENIEKIQKEKLELRERLNEADIKLKIIIDEVCLYKMDENEKLKNNKFHNFSNIFFSHIRNLNASLVFFGLITTSTLYVIVKKDLSIRILSISIILAIIPILFVFYDTCLSISKIKSKIFQMLVLIFPVIIYCIVIIFIGVELYNSAGVVDRILSIIK